LLKLIKSFNGSSAENFVLLGRERQDVGRPNDEGYPVRTIVKGHFIYSKNYEPNRWPAGDPVTGYMDTDGSPTKTAVLQDYKTNNNSKPWQFSFAKKGGDELYQIDVDPFSMNNLANNSEYAKLKKQLKNEMEVELEKQKDPKDV
jgi:hypothetical protein